MFSAGMPEPKVIIFTKYKVRVYHEWQNYVVCYFPPNKLEQVQQLSRACSKKSFSWGRGLLTGNRGQF